MNTRTLCLITAVYLPQVLPHPVMRPSPLSILAEDKAMGVPVVESASATTEMSFGKAPAPWP